MAIQFTPIVKAATKIIPVIPWDKLNQKKAVTPVLKYKHYKGKGGPYTILMEQVRNELTGELMTVYQGSDGTVWARPSHEFHGYTVTGVRRFEQIIQEV